MASDYLIRHHRQEAFLSPLKMLLDGTDTSIVESIDLWVFKMYFCSMGKACSHLNTQTKWKFIWHFTSVSLLESGNYWIRIASPWSLVMVTNDPKTKTTLLSKGIIPAICINGIVFFLLRRKDPRGFNILFPWLLMVLWKSTLFVFDWRIPPNSHDSSSNSRTVMRESWVRGRSARGRSYNSFSDPWSHWGSTWNWLSWFTVWNKHYFDAKYQRQIL